MPTDPEPANPGAGLDSSLAAQAPSAGHDETWQEESPSRVRILQPQEMFPAQAAAPLLGGAEGARSAVLRGGGASATGLRARPDRDHLDLTIGSIPKKLFSQAWPQTVEGMVNTVDQMVDLFWAGRLPGGFRAIAGLGVAQSFTQFSVMARQGLDQSMRAMVSRAIGARNVPLANQVALQAFAVSAAYSLFTILFGVLFTDLLLNLIGVSPEVHDQAALYMRVQFVTSSLFGFRMMTGSALQAASDVMTPLKATMVTRVLHILLGPFFIFGWWWFPTMGLAGAAFASALAQFAGIAINLYALFWGGSRLHLTLRGYRADLPLLWRMVKVGAPASVSGAERGIAQLALLWFVAPFGDVALAAYSLTRRLEMFLNFGSMGAGQAAGVMVGQNLGAGRPDRAKQSVYWGLLYSQIIPAAVRILVFISPVILVTLFTRQADSVALASVWLQIQVLTAFFMGMAMVFQASFNTAGDTLAPMLVSLVGFWGIELPLAWTLPHLAGLGALGVAYATLIGAVSRLLVYVPYFFWGRWLRVKVF